MDADDLEAMPTKDKLWYIAFNEDAWITTNEGDLLLITAFRSGVDPRLLVSSMVEPLRDATWGVVRNERIMEDFGGFFRSVDRWIHGESGRFPQLVLLDHSEDYDQEYDMEAIFDHFGFRGRYLGDAFGSIKTIGDGGEPPEPGVAYYVAELTVFPKARRWVADQIRAAIPWETIENNRDKLRDYYSEEGDLP